MKTGNLKLPKFIHKGNWKIILYSFLGASIFWLFNALNKEYTANIRQPIEFIFDRQGLVVVSLPEDVFVNVTGGGWNLLRKTSWFNVAPVSISLESPTTTRVMIGSTLRPLLSDQLDELKVNFVISDSLFIKVEPRMEKTIPVKVDSLSLLLRKNYRLVTPITLDRDSVTLSGPESLIMDFPDTLVLKISEEGIDDDFDNEVEIVGLPKLIRLDPDEIEVSFRVNRFISHEKKLALNWSGLPEGSSQRLSASELTLTYLANEDIDTTIPDSLFSLVARFEDIDPEDSSIVPRLEKFPPYVEPIGIDSTTIKVIYE